MPDTKADQGDPQSPNVTELHYQEDIHNPSMEDIASGMEEPDEPAKPAEPEKPKEPEKPAEPAAPVEPAKPAIDEEKLTEKITDSVSKKLIEQFAPADATKEEKKELKDKLKDLEDKAKAEGREITYGEALQFLAEETKASVKEELKSEVKQEVLKDLAKEVEDEDAREKAAKEESDKKTQEAYKSLSSQWDQQTTSLRASGALPTPASTDPEDPANKVYVDFLQQMKTFNTKQLEEGKPEVTNMVEFHTLHYKKPTEEPGKNSPVFGAKRSVRATGEGDLSYADVHNSSLEDIVAGR